MTNISRDEEFLMSLAFEIEISERSSRELPGRRVRIGGRCCPVLSDLSEELEVRLRLRLRLFPMLS